MTDEYYHPLTLAPEVAMRVDQQNEYVRLDIFVRVPFKFESFVDLDEPDIDWLIKKLGEEKKRLQKDLSILAHVTIGSPNRPMQYMKLTNLKKKLGLHTKAKIGIRPVWLGAKSSTTAQWILQAKKDTITSDMK